jgi:hypothetical protein
LACHCTAHTIEKLGLVPSEAVMSVATRIGTLGELAEAVQIELAL